MEASNKSILYGFNKNPDGRVCFTFYVHNRSSIGIGRNVNERNLEILVQIVR